MVSTHSGENTWDAAATARLVNEFDQVKKCLSCKKSRMPKCLYFSAAREELQNVVLFSFIMVLCLILSKDNFISERKIGETKKRSHYYSVRHHHLNTNEISLRKLKCLNVTWKCLLHETKFHEWLRLMLDIRKNTYKNRQSWNQGMFTISTPFCKIMFESGVYNWSMDRCEIFHLTFILL